MIDPYRLPCTVVPTRYDLRLEPDLTTFSFTGQETITVTVTEATTEIWMNAVELQLTAVVARNEAGRRVRGQASTEDSTERCRIALDEALSPGVWRLDIAFTGELNAKLRGFYRSTYKDASGTTRTLAATQFEATDARRAFPCWDEPSFKAVFASTLAIDPALTAVSNTAIVSERQEAGKKVITFADTIKMPTYLVAFVVGELEASDAVMVGRTPLRVWSVPGKKRLTGFGQEIAAASLAFFEQYYGCPYPGDKLDLLAIPDFAAGAMENLGAITFRETALLVDPTEATHAELERVADVVAHENAHMWFGDLVTMAWWNGIWLNEAFATFMEMLAVDAWKPEWHRWTTFGVSRAAAFAVDGLWSTRSIEVPVSAPRDADAMFDVLTYEKGASVLRMLEQYLGPEVFRAGIREYVHRHAFANTETVDLWAALGRASNQPIPAMMDGWIFQPGFPLVTARLDNGQLFLSQQAFTYLPKPPPGASSIPAERRWHVPLRVRVTADGRAQSHSILLDGPEARVPVPRGADAVLVNEGGHGFYRVRYTGALLDRLLGRLSELNAIERFNLVSDAWAISVAGLMTVPEYVEVIARFRHERDRNVWSIIVASLHALNRIIEPADRPRLEALVRDRLRNTVEALGWDVRPGEDELTRQLRGDLLRAFGTLGNDTGTQARAAELYARHVAGATSVDANVLPALIAILAHAGDAARYDEFLDRFRSAITPQEEQRHLYALTGFRQPELLEQTLQRTINDEIRTQDAPFVVRTLLMSVYGRELAWRFVKTNWDTMDRKYPKHGLRRMAEGVTGLATAELERDVREFFTVRKIDLGGKTLEQYFEQLHVAVTLRQREGAGLAEMLASFAGQP